MLVVILGYLFLMMNSLNFQIIYSKVNCNATGFMNILALEIT